MKKRLIAAFDALLAANQNGKVENLFIMDESEQFRENVCRVLSEWGEEKSIHVVTVDEREGDWLSDIQERVLFDKLNQTKSVLVVKNYATVLWGDFSDNTPRNFLRDAVMNRHYGCGNDFVPSDELPNLMFVVAINDLSKKYWDAKERSFFVKLSKEAEN